MATIVEIGNPFTPLKDTRQYQHVGGVTIRCMLEEQYPGFKEFARPTLCFVNGQVMMRKPKDNSPGWDSYTVAGDDVINFVTSPGLINAVYFLIVALIAVVAVSLLLSVPKPVVPGETAAPDPVFDLKGQRNQNRLSHPIEVPYGKCRLYPSYASRSFNEYLNNKQYQYSLYCLGQGEFDIHSLQFEDTDIANFDGTTYEVYGPGVPPTMFPNNVYTSADVSSIEIFGPNEPDYVIIGPFSANPSGTLADKIQVDIVFPQGLYLGNADGTLGLANLSVLIQYREIDNAGAPVGGGTWLELFNLMESLKTNTPQRFTLQKDGLTPARYEVRVQRTNNKNLSSAAANSARWEALRAYLPSSLDFGNVTTVAVRALADNNLNDNSSQRFNIWATRKLPTRVSGVWTAVTATRNPIWAFCDVFRAKYGGQLLDMFLDITDLETMAATMASENRYFDFVFDQAITVWDAATTVARILRARPMLVGSQVTIIRDTIKTLTTGVFAQDNIVENSFKWEIKLPQVGDYDGVQIKYTDPVTWKDETVDCLVGDDAGDNPEQITLAGCTQRPYAYQEGMYIRACRKILRENISFQTGLEGHIPTYGDLVKISHDLPRWGTSGLVTALADDNVTVSLSEPVTFAAGSYVIGFRHKDGSESGPHACTAGANANEIILTVAIDPTIFFFDGKHELPIFYFGLVGFAAKACIVVGMAPSDEETVEVKCVVQNNAIFAADGNIPADIPDGPHLPPKVTVPVLNCSNLNAQWLPTGKVLVSWSPAIGARGYQVETTLDNGASFNAPVDVTATSLQLDHIAGQDFGFRVTPLGNGSIRGAACNGGPDGGGYPGFTPPYALGENDYFDFFQVVFPTVEFLCRTRGNGASLCGLPEYTDPSVPPKKYRLQTLNGTLQDCVYPGSCPDEPAGSGSQAIWSGHYKYDKDSCSTENTQNEAAYGRATCASSPTFSYNSALTSSDLSVYLKDRTDITADKTNFHMTAHGVCEACGSYLCKANGSLSGALTDEDSDQDAINRSNVTYDWTDFGPPEGVGCESRFGNRGAGEFSFDYKEAEFKASGSGLNDSDLCIMRVTLYRKDLVTLVAELAETRDYSTYADGLGGFSFQFTLPLVRGFSYYIHDIGFYKLGE